MCLLNPSMLSFHFCRSQRQKIHRRQCMRSFCQCQLRYLLVFARPSLVGPKQSSSFRATVPSANTSKHISKLQKINFFPAFSSFSKGLTPLYSLNHLWLSSSLKAACPNSLQILPLLPLSMFQQPPIYPPQHPPAPDPSYGHLTTITSAQSNLLPSHILSFSLCPASLIPLKYFFQVGFLFPGHINSLLSKYK